MKPILQPLSVLTALFLTAHLGLAQTLSYDSDFEDQTLGRFKIESSTGNEHQVLVPNFGARDGTRALRLRWSSANYTGSRSSRGIELAGTREGTRAKRESWFGFSIYIPSSGFPANKDFILAQLIAWHPACETNKTVALSIVNNQLYVRAYSKPMAGPNGEGTVVVDQVLQSNPPRNQWIDIVIHSRLSKNNSGFLRVWYQNDPINAPRLNRTGINLGGGCFESNDTMTYGVYPKAGMYNYDVANFGTNETREIWLDAVRFINTATNGGYDLVHPRRKTFLPVPTILSVSNQQSPNTAAKLFDGNTSGNDGTRWSAQYFPQSVTFDLGSTYRIREVDLYPHKNRAYQYTLGISTSAGGPFTTIVNRSNNTAGGSVLNNLTINTPKGRYLRLNVTGASGYSGNWVAIDELVLMGAP